jgi:hypothetical protein
VLEIVRADPRSIEIAFGVDVHLPAVAVIGVDDDQIVGSGGLAWGGGRCWLFFTMPLTKPGYAVPVVREAKRLLRQAVQLGENSVFTPRDDAFPRSAKLLAMLGFEPAETMMIRGSNHEIWRWSAVNVGA